MPVYLHTVAVSAYPSQCQATAMSVSLTRALSEYRLAPDATAYTWEDFENWYGTHARQMWEEAAATEHSQSQWRLASDCIVRAITEHSQSHTRLAADGAVYTYADFDAWYGAHPREMWEEAAATEHSGSTGLQASFSASEPRDSAGATVRAGAVPRNATEHSLMQCVACERLLCSTEDLAFFRRPNKQGGVEVHLMLKPENQEPATFIRAPVIERGAIASWQCTCGVKFGDTRAVAVRKAPMTAFKSSSIMLCGQRFTGSKSKWPSIYDQPPFNAIEVRTRDTFLGTTPASGSAS